MALLEKNEMREYFAREIGQLAMNLARHPVRTSVEVANESVGFAIRHPLATVLLGPYMMILGAAILTNV